jgi:serpin B
MIKFSLLALCTALHVCHAASPIPTTTPSQSITRTGWQLVRTVPKGNVVVSPLSVWTALGMAHAGATGGTAQEMAKAMNAPNDNTFFSDHGSRLQHSFTYNKDARIQLHMANRMWVQNDLDLEPLFVTNLHKQFHSSMGLVDFRHQPQAARHTINHWVAQQTAQRIPELMPPDSVGPKSALVLTNALYLNAPWARAFEVGNTHDEAFKLNNQRDIQTSFMHQRIDAMAGKTGRGSSAATVCELPYAGGQLKMVLYVPDRVDGLDAMLAKLEHMQPELKMQAVRISLPKWKASQSLQLNGALQKLGMHKAFDRRYANFSGMRKENDLFISHVVHQSFVEVNEAGTEAAAATGVSMMMRSSLQLEAAEPLAVQANRPFAWAIVDSTTGTPLFTGVVRDPRP